MVFGENTQNLFGKSFGRRGLRINMAVPPSKARNFRYARRRGRHTRRLWVASKNSRKGRYVGVFARSEGGSRDTLSRAHFFHSRHQSAPPPALPVQLTRVYHPRFPRAPPIYLSFSLALSSNLLLSLSLYLSLLPLSILAPFFITRVFLPHSFIPRRTPFQ